MKVILLQDIKGIGKKFEIKELKDGYVRNFLLPKKLAEIALEKSIKKLDQQKTVWEENKKRILSELQEKAKEVESTFFSFKLKAGEKDEVFGSINRKDIENAVKEKFSIDFKINLEKPLKGFGDHIVEADLGEGVKAKLKITINRES